MKKLLLTLTAIAVMCGIAYAGDLSKSGSALPDQSKKSDFYNLIDSYLIKSDIIDNANINSSAAIAGTKITPVFGAQDISTTATASAANLSVTHNLQVDNDTELANVLSVSGSEAYYLGSAFGEIASSANLTISRNLSISNFLEGPVVISGNTTSNGNLSVSSINNDLVENITIKAWAQYDESPVAIRGGFNVDSIEVTGTGRVKVHWDTAFRDATGYAVVATSNTSATLLNGDTTTGYAWIGTDNGAGTAQTGDDVCVIAIGEQVVS